LITASTAELLHSLKESNKEIEKTTIMCKDLKLTTASIRAMTDQCATKSIVNRLENFTETLASKATVQDLRNEIAAKSSIEHLEAL
jgi:hypothetical protein